MQPSSFRAIRWTVGYVFVLVGILKWTVGDFRIGFEKIGMPYPEISVLVIGSIEWICGSLLLFNLHIRRSTIPLMIVMIGAIITTKIPILLQSSLWKFAFEAKLDMVMLALLFVLWKESSARSPGT